MSDLARTGGALPGALPVPVPALEQAREIDEAANLADPLAAVDALYVIAGRLSRENAEKAELIAATRAVFAEHGFNGPALAESLPNLTRNALNMKDQWMRWQKRDEARVAALEAEREETIEYHEKTYAWLLDRLAAAALVGEQAAEPDECHICHRSRTDLGELWCSYPHPQLVHSTSVVARSSENDDTRALEARADALVEYGNLRREARRLRDEAEWRLHSGSLKRPGVLPADEPERGVILFDFTRNEVGRLIDGVARFVQPDTQDDAPLLRKLQDGYRSAGVFSSEPTKKEQQ